MDFADIFERWPAIATGLGGLGGGGLIVKWWEHDRKKREQTDEVALALVTQLRQRMDEMEVRHDTELGSVRAEQQHERELCDARISSLQHKLDAVHHELRAEAGLLDGIMLALKHAPEKAAEIVAEAQVRRLTMLKTRLPEFVHPEPLSA